MGLLLDLSSLDSGGVRVYTYQASGGIVFAGSAIEKFVRTYAASGGIIFSGSATEKFVHAYAASGGIVFGGVAGVDITDAVTASGGVVFGGVSTTSFVPSVQTYVYAGSGGITFSGRARTVRPVASLDSRGFAQRFHGHAPVEPVSVQSVVSRQIRGSADAVATVGSARAVSFVGSPTVSASMSTTLVGHAAATVAGSVQPTASVVAYLRSSVAQGMVGQTTAHADVALRPIPFRSAQTYVGRPSVVIGPDLVAEEEDELFFLLEVA